MQCDHGSDVLSPLPILIDFVHTTRGGLYNGVAY